MNWDSQASRDGRHIRATPTRIAASLAEGIIQGTNVLRARLQEQGFPSRDPKRFYAEGCVLECVLFEWFLRDLVVSAEFGRHRDAIRQALGSRLRVDLERSGLAPTALMEFVELHPARFVEYGEAFEATSSLQALGAAAWLRIVGGPEPSDRMTMLLAVRATASLRALQGLARRYAVIGPLMARLRSPREPDENRGRDR